MKRQIQDYIKIFHNAITSEICQKTIQELKKSEWSIHSYYNVIDNTNTNYDKELSVNFAPTSTRNELMQIIWNSLHSYIIELNFKWFSTWAGFEPLRFNKYDKNTLMRLHCDHIHSMFDGEKKGIPTLTILGLLNNDFKGGEFFMFDEDEVKLKAGDIIIFPSNFLYPHEVKEITDGVRYSFVSWSY